MAASKSFAQSVKDKKRAKAMDEWRWNLALVWWFYAASTRKGYGKVAVKSRTGNWTYWHVNCEAIPKSKRFGWSDRSDVKQPLCMACNTRFYTEENAEPVRMLDHAKYHPMYCHGKCRAVLQRSEFRSGMLKNGGKQKLCAKCQG